MSTSLIASSTSSSSSASSATSCSTPPPPPIRKVELSVPQLLAADEPSPVLVAGDGSHSPFVIACDHAGRRIPRALGDLGVSEAERGRHIAWDIGAWAVSRRLVASLGALAVSQVYSRLVIDCNRTPGVESSIPAISEHTEIPGNLGLTQADKDARRVQIMAPYHDRLAQELDQRASRPTILIAMHSFTPSYKGAARPWHIGVLFDQDQRLSRPLLDLLVQEPGLVVGENEPYALNDSTDYTVPRHAVSRGLPHVELEIRQDLITDEAGQSRWAELLTRLLPLAAAGLTG